MFLFDANLWTTGQPLTKNRRASQEPEEVEIVPLEEALEEMDTIESSQWSMGGTWKQPENGWNYKQVKTAEIRTELNRVQLKSRKCLPIKVAAFRANVYAENICICAEWGHYGNTPARTRLNNIDAVAKHLFVNSTCNVKCVGTARAEGEANML